MFSLGRMARILGDNPKNHLPPGAAEELPAAVVTDSRQAGPGSLFVCIKGERSDGHDFIPQVAEAGALAVLASRDVFDGNTPPLPVIYTDDAVRALGALASAQRDEFTGFVIGLTGSAGKTSVKELLASVLATRGATAKNYMNLNSQIGLAVSILNADAQAEFWVMEAGISQPHDMDELGAVLRPDLGMVLNVGAAHLSGLGDRGVAYYKTRLLTHIKPGGSALVSADYGDLAHEAAALGKNTLYFSTRNSVADFYAKYLGPSGLGADLLRGRYLARIKGEQDFELDAPFRGSYGAENVAAVCGAASLAGLSPEEIGAGIAAASLPAQRFEATVIGDFVVIDDSYNSNPLAAGRMLESAGEIAAQSRAPLFLIMGEMLELGDEAESAHWSLGRQMAASGARVILWKGGQAAVVMAGLTDAGFGGIFRQVATDEDFRSAMREFDDFAQMEESGRPRGVALFKASRGLRLELWAAIFKNEYFPTVEPQGGNI